MTRGGGRLACWKIIVITRGDGEGAPLPPSSFPAAAGDRNRPRPPRRARRPVRIAQDFGRLDREDTADAPLAHKLLGAEHPAHVAVVVSHAHLATDFLCLVQNLPAFLHAGGERLLDQDVDAQPQKLAADARMCVVRNRDDRPVGARLLHRRVQVAEERQIARHRAAQQLRLASLRAGKVAVRQCDQLRARRKLRQPLVRSSEQALGKEDSAVAHAHDHEFALVHCLGPLSSWQAPVARCRD